MSSENKKRKAVNSFIFNGGEKLSMKEWKCKRIMYYNKKTRNEIKKITRKELKDIEVTEC